MKTFQTLPNGDPSLEEDKGAKTAWHFHEATGSLLKKEYADGHGPTYAYTEAGQLKERQWARTVGQAPRLPTDDAPAKAAAPLTTAYTYDPATLLLTKSTATDGTTVTYEYNPEGQLAKVTDATGSREFTYDIRGQILKESVTLITGADTAPIRYEIRRSYTSLGQPESVRLVGADSEILSLDHKVEYSWNARNQLASVKSLAGEFVYGYDEANPALLTKMSGPVHEVETTYEPHRNLITGVTNRRKVAASGDGSPRPLAEGAPISSYAYSNDVLGRRETISQGGEAFAMMNLGETKVDVAYNERSEVVGASYRSGNETRQQFEYDYDGIGNRKSAASEVMSQKARVSYETNALNQYIAIKNAPALAADSLPGTKNNGPRTTYDLDGNLIEDHKNRYTWDAENRLVRVESNDGTLRIDYVYDHQSRRTLRTITREPGTKNEERRTTYFLYDDWNLLAELEETKCEEPGTKNYVQRTFTWARDLSGSLQGAGGVGGLLALSESGKHRFPAFDANGNVGQLLDENARAVAAYTYDPVGNVTEMAGAEAEQNQWRFSTKPVEAGTGWVYYGFRYYDPAAGRWTSRDPIEEQGSFNLYEFVGNNAVGIIDVIGQYSLKFPGYHRDPDILENKKNFAEMFRLVDDVRGVSSIAETFENSTPTSNRKCEFGYQMIASALRHVESVAVAMSSMKSDDFLVVRHLFDPERSRRTEAYVNPSVYDYRFPPSSRIIYLGISRVLDAEEFFHEVSHLTGLVPHDDVAANSLYDVVDLVSSGNNIEIIATGARNGNMRRTLSQLLVGPVLARNLGFNSNADPVGWSDFIDCCQFKQKFGL